MQAKKDGYVWIECHRCCGVGYFHCWGHIHNGKCFACNGTKGRWESEKVIKEREERAAKRQLAAQKRFEAKKRKLAAKVADFIKQNNITLDYDKAGKTSKQLEIIESLLVKLNAKGSLTEKQVHLLQKLQKPTVCTRCNTVGHNADQCPTIPDIIEGRYEIVGKIVHVKLVESSYGYHDTSTLKCLVVSDNGLKYWGTLPRLDEDTVIQRRVSFHAKVERSNKDPKFGVYKRPTRAKLLD